VDNELKPCLNPPVLRGGSGNLMHSVLVEDQTMRSEVDSMNELGVLLELESIEGDEEVDKLR
jgi:hypothetical protein